MIQNHEGPDEPIRPRDTEDWSICSACHEISQDPPRCGVCGCLVCDECWDEHHAECTDEPDRNGKLTVYELNPKR